MELGALVPYNLFIGMLEILKPTVRILPTLCETLSSPVQGRGGLLRS